MSNSQYSNEPTIGGRAIPRRANGDGTPGRRVGGGVEHGPASAPKGRSYAQPLPDAKVEEVHPRADASTQEQAEALTKNSKSGKNYKEEALDESDEPDLGRTQASVVEKISALDLSPPPSVPEVMPSAAVNDNSDLVAEPEAQSEKVCDEVVNDEIINDDDLDAMDPLEEDDGLC